MGYKYHSKRFSYESPTPKKMDSAGVEELIDMLKASIDAGKLKDLKSALSKLKLSINNEYPVFTQESATFGAYVYAVKSGNKKSVDSIFKALIKKNFTFDGIPLLTLLTNMDKSDFKIILDDYLVNKDAKFYIDGSQTIKELLKKFPKEAEQLIQSNRLNKFTKGDTRVEIAMSVLSGAKEFDSIISALTTFFDISYVQQYGINQNKLRALRTALDDQPKAMVEKVLKEYFYMVFLKDIPSDIFISDVKQNLLDDTSIENYTIQQFRIDNQKIIEILENIVDEELRSTITTVNDEITNYVMDNAPELLPKTVTEVFLF